MKIALLPNLTNARAAETTSEICKWLNKYDVQYATEESTADQLDNVQGLLIMEFPELINWCDAVITVGGDGSMLHAAKRIVDYEKPILCINAGRLAFMAGLERDELSLLKNLSSGDYFIDRRMLIDVSLVRNRKIIKQGQCINDAVLCRGEDLRISDINVDCDGRRINTYRADGVIVATPTGSSAYSLSAGGPVIDPGIEAIVVTPICAQSLFARSIVFSSENRIAVYIDDKSRAQNQVLSFDGEDMIHIEAGDVIYVTKSQKYANFIRIKNDSFFDILNKKLAGTEVHN